MEQFILSGEKGYKTTSEKKKLSKDKYFIEEKTKHWNNVTTLI